MIQSKWKLEELYPSIFHLQFANHYDACMHWLRYQENYESPKFRNKIFTLLEYMEWYAKNQCEWKKTKGKKKVPVQMFSYPGDWGGFNVPSYVFDRLTRDTIPDWNGYDVFMHAIVKAIKSLGHEKFYLIGTVAGRNAERYLDHEVSHGLYYVNDTYRDEAQYIFYNNTNVLVCQVVREYLTEQGYCNEVVVDEAIAYFATGLPDKLKKSESCKKAQGPYRRLFKKTTAALEADSFCHYV